MTRHLLAFAVLLLGTMQFAYADVRELSRTDLRSAVANNQAISSNRLIEGVQEFTGGSVVNIRAFEFDGQITYRILVRQNDGTLGAIMLEGDSGRVVMPSTDVGQSVSRFASETRSGSSDSQPAAPRSSSSIGGTNNGNGNGGRNTGNGNGNGGGNNGNGGGNNGNGNGNGGGNGGGNNGNGGGNGGGNNGNGGGNGGGNNGNGNGGGGGNNGNGNGKGRN